MKGDWSTFEWNIMYVHGLAAVDQRGVGGRWGSRVVRSLLHPPHSPDAAPSDPPHPMRWGRAFDAAVARGPSMRWPRSP